MENQPSAPSAPIPTAMETHHDTHFDVRRALKFPRVIRSGWNCRERVVGWFTPETSASQLECPHSSRASPVLCREQVRLSFPVPFWMPSGGFLRVPRDTSGARKLAHDSG